MSDREKIRNLVRQLLERTTARGCTEAEAMEAAHKAAELMRSHGLHSGDVEFEQASSPAKAGSRSSKALLWGTIAVCTNSAAIVQTKGSATEVIFVGRAPGPQIAVYLRDVCERAIDRAVADFKTSTFYRRRRSTATKRAAIADFTVGMIIRMRGRLRMLFVETLAKGAAKIKEAEAELDRRFPKSGVAETKAHKERYSDAVDQGYRAGARVTLAHGVAGGSTSAPLQIGRS